MCLRSSSVLRSVAFGTTSLSSLGSLAHSSLAGLPGSATDFSAPTNLLPFSSSSLSLSRSPPPPPNKQFLLLLCVALRHHKMLNQSLSKPSISFPIPICRPPSLACSSFGVRCAESVDSQPKASPNVPAPSSATKLMKPGASAKSGPYPDGMMGPYTGRDPNVKKARVVAADSSPRTEVRGG